MRRLNVLATGPAGATAGNRATVPPASAGRATVVASHHGYPAGASVVNDLRHSGARAATTSGAFPGGRTRTPDSFPTS